MKPLIFSYKTYHQLTYPIITIEVRGANVIRNIDAYVDSGATYSIFSVEEASRLKIPFLKGKEINIKVGDGNSIPVYIHTLPVRIGHVSFKATIGFSHRLGVGFNIIGRMDFFERFDITFSEARRRVILYPR